METLMKLDELAALVDHVVMNVSATGATGATCIGTFTETTRWATGRGLDPDAVVADLRRLGAGCDCDVPIAATEVDGFPPVPGVIEWLVRLTGSKGYVHATVGAS